ncbi:MAG: hypothetical protein D6804_00580 [Aquificota bacterium]|nr:MAG: hypothetical protein D6804_00580 [Aquificota bacterium]
MTLLSITGLSYSQQPFQSLEGAVGYIVVERGGKVENYVVVEGKDGSVRTVKVDKNPAQFMKKTEEPREGGRK